MARAVDIIAANLAAAGAVLAELSSKAALALSKSRPAPMARLGSSARDARDSSSVAKVLRSTTANRWTKLANLRLYGNQGVVSALLAYQAVSLPHETPAFGHLDVRLSGPAHLSEASMRVTSHGSIPASASGTWSADDFRMILTSTNPGTGVHVAEFRPTYSQELTGRDGTTAVPIVINPNGSLMAVASLGAGTNITVGSTYRID